MFRESQASMLIVSRNTSRVGIFARTMAGIGLLYVGSSYAQSSCSALYCFSGTTDGASPAALANVNGTIYGVASKGGTKGDGTVFQLSSAGSFTQLHAFAGTDGAYPTTVLAGEDGNLYGVSATGGGSTSCNGGCGTIFKITPSGTLTTLHAFGLNKTPDGGQPNALIEGTDGNLYGTTEAGTVFQLTLASKFTTLYTFGGNSDYPNTIVQGSDGNFYGTTRAGGAYASGSVFQLTLSGMLTTLYSFGSQSADAGVSPNSLLQGSDGNFYGTVLEGGPGGGTTGNGNAAQGFVFKLTPAGALTVLYTFQTSTGQFPVALIFGGDNNLYGVTQNGGVNSDGVVFRLTTSGSFSTVYSLNGSSGQSPSSLIDNGQGTLFVTASTGGPSNDGTIIQIAESTTQSLPAVNVSLGVSTILIGQPFTVTWTSTNATSCTAVGGGTGDSWAGATLPISGSKTVTESARYTSLIFSVTCAGSGGSATGSAQAQVVAASSSGGSDASTGGGGAVFGWELLAGLAVLAQRRRRAAYK